MRALARILTHPANCLLFGALFFLDWTSLPNSTTQTSTAARCLVSRHVTTACLTSIPVALFRTPEGLRAFLLSSGRPDDAPDWRPVIEFALARAPNRFRGFWAMTSITEKICIFGDGSFTAAEHDQLIPELIRAFDAEPDWIAADPVTYSLLKSGHTARTRVLPGGYVHNAAALVFAVVFVAGLPRLLAAAGRAVISFPREHRADRRLSRGQCPECAYDLRAEFEEGCPECGWNRGGVPGA